MKRAKARPSAGGPSEPEGANPPPEDGAGDTGEPVVPDQAALYASLVEQLEEVRRANKAMHAQAEVDHRQVEHLMASDREKGLKIAALSGEVSSQAKEIADLTRAKEESDPYEGALGKVAEEVFVEAHGTALLVSVMSEKVSVNRDSKAAQTLEKKTINSMMFRPGSGVAQDFWDLRTLFHRYYEWVANELFREWPKDEVELWNAFVEYHKDVRNAETSAETVRDAVRAFLAGKRTELKWGSDDEHVHEVHPSLRLEKILHNNAGVPMSILPNVWYSDDARKQGHSIESGIKTTWSSKLSESQGWNGLIAGLSTVLSKPMNRVAANAALEHATITMDEKLFQAVRPNDEDPLDSFIVDLNQLRQATRLSTDLDVHLEEDGDGTNDHRVPGPFFMNKMPKLLRAYWMSGVWKSSTLGKRVQKDFGGMFGGETASLDALKCILRANVSPTDAQLFPIWKKSQHTYYRLGYKNGKFCEEQSAHAAKPKNQLNMIGANLKNLSKEACDDMWDEFGRAFSDKGDKKSAPKTEALKKLQEGSDEALDQVYSRAKNSQLCHKCLSHPYWSREDKKAVPCPLDKLKQDNPVKKGWLEFFSALKPAAARSRAQTNNRH